MKTMDARSEEELSTLSDCIRGCWIDVGSIEVSSGTLTARLQVPGDSLREQLVSSPAASASAALLKIESVVGYDLDDTEGVGFYDIEAIEFDGGVLRLRTGVPLLLDVRVTDINLGVVPVPSSAGES